MIELIRRAKIFDYINKPWQPEAFLSRLEKGIDFFRANRERRLAFEELKTKNEELSRKNLELAQLMHDLEEGKKREEKLNEEISAWAPAPIVTGIKTGKLQLPMERDLVGVTYDIIESGGNASKKIGNRSVRSHVVKIFTECLLKHGGLPESWAGDSMYGHFGAIETSESIFSSALAAAQEFRVALRTFSEKNQFPIECGIALHYVENAMIQLDETKVLTEKGEQIQKSFYTESPEIDLLHRIEKLIHDLPGSNIVFSKNFSERVDSIPPNAIDLGLVQSEKMKQPRHLIILPSYFVTPEVVEKFKEKFGVKDDQARAAA